MARLQVKGGGPTFDVLGEDGSTLATGTLQVEYVPGAQRLGSVSFVLDEQPEQPLDGTQALAEAGRGGGI